MNRAGKAPRSGSIKLAAKIYAHLETVETFSEAVDLYLSLKELGAGLRQDIEPMKDLAPMVTDYPEDLQKAISDAHAKWVEWHAKMNLSYSEGAAS